MPIVRIPLRPRDEDILLNLQKLVDRKDAFAASAERLLGSLFMRQGQIDKAPWTMEKMDPAALDRMMRMIVPCRLSIDVVDGTWKERGKGELRVNVAKEEPCRARLVMRSKGNLRVLLNASLQAFVTCTKMDGQRGASFPAVNCASLESEAVAEEGKGSGGGEAGEKAAAATAEAAAAAAPELSTFAFRIARGAGSIDAFTSAVERHREKKTE